jgi:hypothetical protein
MVSTEVAMREWRLAFTHAALGANHGGDAWCAQLAEMHAERFAYLVGRTLR